MGYNSISAATTKGVISNSPKKIQQNPKRQTQKKEQVVIGYGYYYDGKTGLYYMNARYYDPANGRFISQDTYRGGVDNTDQWHLYVYCANNPINYVDPSGHFSIKVSGTSIIAKVSFVVI